MKKLRVLVACEESQVVCKAFRERGHEAYSNDLIECSGGFPEWHLQMDALEAIKLMDWDMMIAHPPCTFMSKAGARWMYAKGVLNQERFEQAMTAKEFFLELLNVNIDRIAIENPTPLKIVGLPEHSQVIQPYYFGDNYSKRTLLWLKNLPPLIYNCTLNNPQPFLPSNTGGKKRGEKYSFGISKSQKESSKTFPGFAAAMAEQWGDLR